MGKVKTISVVVNARVKSSRVNRKIVRPFYSTTLLDISLSKLQEVSDYEIYVATAEQEIVSIVQKYTNIKILERSQESVEKGWKPHITTFAHYFNVPTTHIMMVNPCLPFLKVETVLDAADVFLGSSQKSMTSVKSVNNVLFDSDFNLLTNNKLVSTQNQEKIYEMAHAFHIFDKEYFMQREKFWDYSDGHPGHYVMPTEECYDVDTPLDFVVCETLYKKFGENINAWQ